MKEYWLTKPAEEVANFLVQYHSRWESWGSNSIASAWGRNQVIYYSPLLDPTSWDTSLIFEGEQGELVKMAVPQARALARQFISLTTKNRLAFNAISLTRGTEVQKATRLANALTVQIVDKERLDRKREDLAELAFVHGASFQGAFWRTDRGQPFSMGQQGEMLYDGDLEIRNFSVFDVFFDYRVEAWEEKTWVELRRPVSRWDLVAQFPDLKDYITSLPSIQELRGPQPFNMSAVGEDDLVFVYELYVKPSPAIQMGRMMMYGDSKTIFHDGDNVYGGIPIEQCRPEPVIGTAFGYPLFSNLIPAQEMLDHSFSAIATNQSAFAVQNVTVPRGAGISVQQIQGMNFIHFTPMRDAAGGGKPEPLQLTQSSPETFKFIEVLRSHMQEVSNINSALRGAPPPGVTSGAAIATLTTNAMEFLTSFAKSIDGTIERTMTNAIKAYRQFASVPHLVSLAGPQGKSVNKEFVGDDLATIQNVKINQMNPVMLTSAGRSDLAEKLLQTGLIKSAKQYFSVLEGDPVSVLYQTELSEDDLINAENETMMEGQDVMALITDDHPDHIRQHHALLNDPEIRRNNKIIDIVLSHIEKHAKLAREQDPFLTAMLRTGTMPEGGPPPPPQQAGGAPNSRGAGGPPPLGPGAGSGPTAQPAQPARDLLERG